MRNNLLNREKRRIPKIVTKIIDISLFIDDR